MQLIIYPPRHLKWSPPIYRRGLSQLHSTDCLFKRLLINIVAANPHPVAPDHVGATMQPILLWSISEYCTDGLNASAGPASPLVAMPPYIRHPRTHEDLTIDLILHSYLANIFSAISTLPVAMTQRIFTSGALPPASPLAGSLSLSFTIDGAHPRQEMK